MLEKLLKYNKICLTTLVISTATQNKNRIGDNIHETFCKKKFGKVVPYHKSDTEFLSMLYVVKAPLRK
jgi:hypothetical protein